jgi:hypothetical protein
VRSGLGPRPQHHESEPFGTSVLPDGPVSPVTARRGARKAIMAVTASTYRRASPPPT